MANVMEQPAGGAAAAGSTTVIGMLPVIIATVVIALVISLIGGDKALKPFLALVLLSMVVTNSATIAKKLESVKGVINP
jgi:hypothetical protein